MLYFVFAPPVAGMASTAYGWMMLVDIRARYSYITVAASVDAIE